MKLVFAISALVALTLVGSAARAQDEVDLDHPDEPVPAEDPARPPPPPPPPPREPLPIEEPPATPMATLWGANLSLTGGGYQVSNRRTGLHDDGLSLSGGASLTRYLTPVLDNDDPRSLQVFLQRKSSFGLGFSGGGSAGTSDDPYRYSWLQLRSGGTFYVLPWLVVQPSVAYRYNTTSQGDKTHEPSGSLGLGLRFDNSEIDLTYGLRAVSADGVWAPVRWGYLEVSWFGVIDRHIYVNPAVTASDDSLFGSLDAGYYFTRDVGIFASAWGGSSVFRRNAPQDQTYYVSGGASYWASLRARLSIEYALRIGDTHLASSVLSLEHSLTLASTSRF